VAEHVGKKLLRVKRRVGEVKRAPFGRSEEGWDVFVFEGVDVCTSILDSTLETQYIPSIVTESRCGTKYTAFANIHIHRVSSLS